MQLMFTFDLPTGKSTAESIIYKINTAKAYVSEWTLNHCPPFQKYFNSPGEDGPLFYTSALPVLPLNHTQAREQETGNQSLTSDVSCPRWLTSSTKSYAVLLDRTAALSLM